MFPFDLPGPQFLTFYAVFASVVIVAFYFGRRFLESGPLPSVDLTDPLLFACLRGGPKEVVRVATVGLIDRGLLKVSGRTVTRSAEAKSGIVHRRLEQQVLIHFEHGGEIDSIFNRSAAERVAAEDYESQLTRLRLVPDAGVLKMRVRLLVATLVALLGVGGIKLIIALAAGRSNVMFLIVLMAVAVAVAAIIGDPYRTVLGDSYLSGLRSMFQGLRDRASAIRPGSGSREVLWLTALFGVAVLPTSAFPFVPQLWPKPKPTSSSGCGSASGSSGGGGCGGGGGGCGGCGS